MIRDPLTLALALVAITALAFWLDRRFPLFSKIGAALLVIVLGGLLSNSGLVPRASPVYAAVEGPVLSLAIVFLLFSVRLADLRAAGPAMAAAFAVGALGAATGAATGALVFAGALGAETWKLAGAFTGTYVGGSLNFAAVGRALGLDPSVFAAASAADNVTTTAWMAVTLALPLWWGRAWARRRGTAAAAGASPRVHTRAAPASAPAADPAPAPHPYWARVEASLYDLVVLALAGLLVLWLARAAAARVPGVPGILWLTTFALALGQWPAVRRCRWAETLGNFGLHLFLGLIGVYSIVGEVARVGLAVFYYTVWTVAVHGLVLFGLGWWRRADLGVLSVASQACIGGPSTAMAIAVARGWPALLAPGVAAALLGYALGNYLGVGVAWLARLYVGT
jgi:uncharacterized membrane protein